ncbi:extensin [Streptomyces sp. BHT-5-2]|uniref:extensin n=1 Tax=Streptomyces sp. BHT-5-2 TaxID=2866715 RepID=UPI001C8E8D66|nr:extensin [Streptomyces sp. BHT-5-2]QZL02015.1 extensin [Streptomyces sp. BHT-5-2]
MKQIAAREAVQLLRAMTRVLCIVGCLALVFTTVNVTRFATSRDVPLPIAVLLDPMIGTALAGVLYVDARLAAWGITPPAWSTTLRWSAGSTAALMNTWQSLWPDGHIGWPHHADPAAVLLHLTPALLLITLTETIAAYRRTITHLLDQTTSPKPPTAHTLRPPIAPTTPAAQPPTAHRPPASTPASETDRCPNAVTTPANTNRDPAGPETGDNAPNPQPPPTDRPPVGTGATDTDLWPHAVALDNAARATTGKPVTAWRLRNELGVGSNRARRLHNQLQTHRTDRPPPIG